MHSKQYITGPPKISVYIVVYSTGYLPHLTSHHYCSSLRVSALGSNWEKGESERFATHTHTSTSNIFSTHFDTKRKILRRASRRVCHSLLTFSLIFLIILLLLYFCFWKKKQSVCLSKIEKGFFSFWFSLPGRLRKIVNFLIIKCERMQNESFRGKYGQFKWRIQLVITVCSNFLTTRCHQKPCFSSCKVESFWSNTFYKFQKSIGIAFQWI